MSLPQIKKSTSNGFEKSQFSKWSIKILPWGLCIGSFYVARNSYNSPCYGSGDSNTQPVGRIMPASCVYSALVTLKKYCVYLAIINIQSHLI